MASPLTPGEEQALVDLVLDTANRRLQGLVTRLLEENRELREQAGERERMHADEVTW